jgi:hypothetical protein
MPTLAERRAAFLLAADAGGAVHGGSSTRAQPLTLPKGNHNNNAQISKQQNVAPHDATHKQAAETAVLRRSRQVSELRREKAGAEMQKLEQELSAWIEAVLGKPLGTGHLCDVLKSGIILCELLNKVRAGTVRRISSSRLPFPQRENIKAFTDAVSGFGVPDHENFSTDDLFAERNVRQVFICLASFGRHLHNTPGYQGPQFGKGGEVKAHRTAHHEVAETRGLWGKSGGRYGQARSRGVNLAGTVPAGLAMATAQRYVPKSTLAASASLDDRGEAATSVSSASLAVEVRYPGSPAEQALAWIDDVLMGGDGDSGGVESGGVVAAAAAAGGGDSGFATALRSGEVLCALANRLRCVPHPPYHS